MLRWYGYLGLLLMLAAEINFYAAVQPFATWYIVIIWYGYILFVDSIVYMRRGKSIITSYPKEFLFMLLISVPFWLIFELYNLFTLSWHYINYVWYVHLFDFTTILPAVMETFTLTNAFGVGKRFDLKPSKHLGAKPGRHAGPIRLLVLLGGIVMILPALVGPIGFILMWISLCFFFDPLNYLVGRPSLLQKASIGERSALIRASIAGLVMGFFWELWNYQAYPKWYYTLPSFIINIKLFAMPLEGYIGYTAFGASVFLFYAFFRGYLFKGRNELLNM